MVSIILAPGFEEMEAVAPCDLLRRAGVEVRYCGVGGTEIQGSHGITIHAEDRVEALCADDLDMVVLPGGLRGVQSVLADEAALGLLRSAWDAGKYVAAICAGPTVLAHLGIVGKAKAVCYPGMADKMGEADYRNASVVEDGRLITGRAAGSSLDFGLALVRILRGPEAAEKVAKGIVYPPAE